MKHYSVESKWVGWFGGYGSESDIASRMNAMSQQGWQLARTEVARATWFWFLPRLKMLMVWERDGVPPVARDDREMVTVGS